MSFPSGIRGAVPHGVEQRLLATARPMAHGAAGLCPAGPPGGTTPAPEYEAPLDWATLSADEIEKLEKRHAIKIEQMKRFYEALPSVRRTLANVPTLMIMDDHDVTDDWNLNPIWVDRVYKTAFGRAILRNGLAAYTLFQDWGNDPLRYMNEDTAAAGDARRMLLQIARMFPPRASAEAQPATADVPAKPVMDALDTFYGLDKVSKASPTAASNLRHPHQVALALPGAQVPDGGTGQSHPPQLRVARRAAGQRGHWRAKGHDSRRLAGRAGGADRGGTAAGAGRGGAGRVDRPRVVPGVRRQELRPSQPDPDRRRKTGRAPVARHPPHGRH